MKGLTCIFAFVLGFALLAPRAGWAQEKIVPRLSMERVNASLKVEHEWERHDVALGFEDAEQNLAGIGVSYSLGPKLYLTSSAKLPFTNGLKAGAHAARSGHAPPLTSRALALAAFSLPRAGWAQEKIVPRLSMERVNASLKVEHEWERHDVALGFEDAEQNLAGLGLSYSLGTKLYLTGGARLPFTNGLKFGSGRFDLGFSYSIIRDGKFSL